MRVIQFLIVLFIVTKGWNRIKGNFRKLFDLDREDEILRARKLRRDRMEAIKKEALDDEAYCSSDEDSFDVETERTFVQFLRGGLIAL